MPSPRPTKIRLIVVLIALAASLVVGYWAFWWVAGERFQSDALAWIEARRAEGYAIAYAGLEKAGFPSRLRIVFRKPSLATPAQAPRWSWSGDRIEAEISPWAPTSVLVRADGAQAFTLPGRTEPLLYKGSAGTLTASLASDRSLPVRAVAIRDLALADQGSKDALTASVVDIALGHGVDREQPGADSGYELSVLASDLWLPASLNLPLGEHVTRLDLDAELIGDLRPRPWPQALFRWRDDGGVVEVTELEIHYGPLRLTLEGTLALDEAGQPMGAFSARGEGLEETVDALGDRGHLTRLEALGARVALRALSRPSKSGNPELTVPLTLQDRTLSVASLRLLEIPEIDWPPSASNRPE